MNTPCLFCSGEHDQGVPCSPLSRFKVHASLDRKHMSKPTETEIEVLAEDEHKASILAAAAINGRYDVKSYRIGKIERVLRFDGADYKPERDDDRLGDQYSRIFDLMKDGQWRSLPRIEKVTGDPPASISAQLRHMRKARFGGHEVNRRYLGEGLYEYQLLVRKAQEGAA